MSRQATRRRARSPPPRGAGSPRCWPWRPASATARRRPGSCWRRRRSAVLDQGLCETHRGGRVGGVAVGADRVGVLLRHRRAAHHHDHAVAQTRLLERVDVGLEHRHGGGQKGREADDVGLVLLHLLHELLGRHVHAQVVHGEAGALEHDVDEVLADVVHVALDRAHHERADRLGAGLGQQRAQDVQCALHCPSGNQHLRDEEVAALEAGAHLLQGRDQGVIEQRLGVHAHGQALVGEVLDGRRVSDQRVVEQPLQDLVGGHAAPSPAGRNPRRAESVSVSFVRSLPNPSSRSLGIRNWGPEMLIAATARPSASSTGAATATRPGSSSPTAVAYPHARTVSSSADSASRSVMVWGVSRSSAPGWRRAAPNATSTLPTAVQWWGRRRPTQLVVPRMWRLSTWAMYCSEPPGTATARSMVSPVASARLSSASRHSSAMSCSPTPRRARPSSTGPGRMLPRALLRCTRPCRSSADTARDTVLLGSPAASASSPTLLDDSFSTTRTSSWAARSIAWVPVIAFRLIMWNDCSTYQDLRERTNVRQPDAALRDSVRAGDRHPRRGLAADRLGDRRRVHP